MKEETGMSTATRILDM